MRLWAAAGPEIDISVEGDGAWPDLATIGRPFREETGVPVKVAFLDGGTAGGRPSLAIRFDAGEDIVVLELTGRQLQGIAAAFRGKFGDIP